MNISVMPNNTGVTHLFKVFLLILMYPFTISFVFPFPILLSIFIKGGMLFLLYFVPNFGGLLDVYNVWLT